MKHFFTILFLLFSLVVNAQIVYVNPVASGSNNGSSWDNAYRSLQDAVQNTESGDIWIAEGIYKCTESFDRAASFRVNTNVNLYGGFPKSNNPSWEDRDWENFITVLSGDIGVENDTSDNTYHIMSISSWEPFNNTIDGLTFTAANSDYSSGAIDVSGLFDFDSKVTIRNCTFVKNFADYEGAAISSSWTNLVVDNCIFEGNESGYGGGAISYFADHFPTDEVSFVCKNSIFKNNFAGYGGGVADTRGNIYFYNCLFERNFADYEGGVISHFLFGTIKSVNCTFVNNTTNGSGSILDIHSWDEPNTIGASFANCIFHNEDNSQNDLVSVGGSIDYVDISYSALESCPTYVTCGDGNIFTNNPGFVGSGDYRIDMGSDCINAGLNDEIPNDITTDLDGKVRIIDGVVDLGAYELGTDVSIPVEIHAFLDANENGIKDAEEIPLFNQPFDLQPNNRKLVTDEQGQVRLLLSEGEHSLSYQEDALWQLTTQDEYFIDIDTNTVELPNYFFGLTPTRLLSRGDVHLSSSPTRCNNNVQYFIHYRNTGTTTANGTVTLEIDDLMEYISSNVSPDKVEGNRLAWHFSNLPPSHENKIHLQFQMPDFNSIGEILETQTSLQLFNENEEFVYEKSTEYDSELLCSYDPNDKLVRSNILGQSEFAYIEDTILYTIRFQNTGNDVALNIRVEDKLDKKLDWTTFHPITASHDFYTNFNRETGLATFHFDDILLPDSTTNEEDSHGFVTFGIASLANVGDKTDVENTANIFFDFNLAIVTNTAVLTLIQQVETNIEGELLNADYPIAVYPNPFSDFTIIEVKDLPQGNYHLELMDILGRKVLKEKMENGSLVLKRGELENGMYVFQILAENNELIGLGKILVE